MRKVSLFLLMIVISPLYAQQKERAPQKISPMNKLLPSGQEFGAVLITPSEGAPISGVIKQQYRDDYLLDVDDVFAKKRIPSRKNRQKLIPKGKRKITADIKTDLTNLPGTIFYKGLGLYRLDVNNVLTKYGFYRYHYFPHTLEIVTYLGGEFNYKILTQTKASFFTGSFIINVYTENRKKRDNGYTPLLQFRVGYGTSPSVKIPKLGLLFGGSQYVFDLRTPQSGIGWSMLANGGMSFDFSSKFTKQAFLNSLTIGGEVEFKTIYNFHKYVGVTFGLLFGYHLTPMAVIADSDNYDQTIQGSFTLGFIF